jgi:RHS repeat-associated protein
MPDETAVEYAYQGTLLRSVERYDAQQKKLYAHTYSEYDQRGTLLRSSLPDNAGEIAYTHDACGHVTKIESAHWNETLTYDSVGNIIATQTQEYTYDDNDQLTSDGTHTYTYDSINNRRSKDGDAYEINSLNQVAAVGETTYRYDLNGNRIALDSPARNITYRYDALDRLVEVEEGKYRYHYDYDASNRRLSKTAYIDNNIAHQEKYLYLGQNEVGSYDANNSPLEVRILGLSRGAELGAAIALEKNGNTHYPVHDHQGSVVRLIKPDGSLFASMTFTPFGEETTRMRATAWTFSSKRYDPETEFFYFGRRCYDAGLGRWATPDPIGHGDGPNLYAYIHNNPHTHFDEYGLRTVRSWLGYEKLFGGEGSRNYTVGSEEKSQAFFFIGFVNGMVNDYIQSNCSATHVSDMAGGAKVGATYNETHGAFFDFFECALNLYGGIATTPAFKLMEQWDQAFENVPPGCPILQIAHSQGTIHVRNALMMYDPEKAKRIMVVCFGPAAYIGPNLCHSVHHFISKRDIVWLANAIHFLFNPEYVTFLDPATSAKLFDHDFLSETNTKTMQTVINKFKDTVNKYYNENKEKCDQWLQDRKDKDLKCQILC